MIFVIGLWTFLRAMLFGSAAVAIENLALRHQLLVLQRSVGPTPSVSLGPDLMGLAVPRLGGVAIHPGHRAARHRAGLASPRLPALLALEVQAQPGRALETRRRAARPDPTHGAGASDLGPPAHSSGTRLARLCGRRADRRHVHAPAVAAALPDVAGVLATHAREIVAVDFFLVPTLTFRLLFVFIGLRHDRRELIDVNVTDHPTARWVARQLLIEAFPEETAPKYLLRDRDAIDGEIFTRCVDPSLWESGRPTTAPSAPWQNPFVKRVIGSIRREVPRPFPHPERDSSLPASARRRGLRQRRASPPSAGAECAPAPRGATAGARACSGDPAGRRAPPPLSARGLIAVDRQTHDRGLAPLRCREPVDSRTFLPEVVRSDLERMRQDTGQGQAPSPHFGGSRRSRR